MKQQKSPKQPVCQICGEKRTELLRPASLVRKEISDLILQDKKHWDKNGWICLKDLDNYRKKYVNNIVESEKGELTELEHEVITSLTQNDLVSKNVDSDFETKKTLGQRVADKVADFGGSWSFIILFFIILVAWMGTNSYLLIKHPFDPYPYILLNLVLSCLAAIQAPIIMMSQNRQEDRDRARSIQDYKINLKTELELRLLHQKIDHLLNQQWERIMEIQKMQMETIEDAVEENKDNENKKN